MTLQPHRTRSFRRIKVKLPGGKLIIHYKKRKPNQAHCANCRTILHGVPREIPVNLRRLPKVQRRPERMFGGFLCPSCAAKAISNKFNVVNEKIETGRLVVKTHGRDAGKIGAIVDIIDDNYVLLDGQVRRKKANIKHFKTLEQKIKINPKATTDTIINELKNIGMEVIRPKSKPKKDKPNKTRVKPTEENKKSEIPKNKKVEKKK